MLIIGLLGDVASGKSVVAHLLTELGAGLLDGDRAGHELLRRDDVRAAARERWGMSIFAPDGHVHRPALARLVFAGTERGQQDLHYLEQLLHPLIGQKLLDQAAGFRAAGKIAAVLDAPVMLKAGWDKFCDTIIFVDTPSALCEQRALERDWDAAELDRRRAAQDPVEGKRRRANVVIDNSGSLEHTREQVAKFWQDHVTAKAKS
ncbi:MAG: dephospho-CoA kinase [Planctomycetes bacterium]|nr:dephospho-CoA kinase [Planctomycetota bacterium]